MNVLKNGLLWLTALITVAALPAWSIQAEPASCEASLTEIAGARPALTDRELHEQFGHVMQILESKIIGQRDLIEALMIALISDGNILVQGPTGVAKTRAIKVLAKLFRARFNRIQFTPDLMPADITGSEIFDQATRKFEFYEGPIFANFVLADELNRASARTQSAFLEAMEEHQVTVGGITHRLPDVYIVMATQNPDSHEGTYKLPEAQLDRFLLDVEVGYMSEEQNLAMLRLVRGEQGLEQTIQTVADLDLVQQARQAVRLIKTPENIEQFIVKIVQRTQDGVGLPREFRGSIQRGAGPRAIIGLEKAARARAWLHGRDEVTIDDVSAMAPPVLRHRIAITMDAANTGVTSDKVIQAILENVLRPKA